MIQYFIERIEQLIPDNVRQLTDVYHEKAIFIHPFKTVFGKESINRQWRMTLKYCKDTKMYVTDVMEVAPNTHLLQWDHTFTVEGNNRTIKGSTIVVFDSDVIVFQKDTFDLDFFHSLFND